MLLRRRCDHRQDNGVAAARSFHLAVLLGIVSRGFQMTVSTFLIGATEPHLYSMTDGVSRTDNNIPLADVLAWAKHDPIWAARGKAIQGYAELESALCHLLIAVTGMSWEAGVTIFYKITNTNARSTILEKLLHQKSGTKFSAFWNPYVKELRQIDLKRNEIVHWLAAANVLMNPNGQIAVGVTLIPPGSVHTKSSHIHITSRDLYKFAIKCDHFARLARGLATRIKPPDGVPVVDETLPDIFQQPFLYPLPEGHPYLSSNIEPETHPRSCPESLLFLHLAPDGKNLQRWDQ